MAEPVSLAASISGLALIAETVFVNGYKYLMAVRNCEQDVSRLIAECNALCGILGRLLLIANTLEDESIDARG